MWRIIDVKRNSVNNLGHYNFKQKELEGLHPGQVKKLLIEKGIKWEDMPGPYKFGVMIKKANMTKRASIPSQMKR